MEGLGTFKASVRQIMQQYETGDMGYESANVLLDMRMDDLLSANAIDMPDEVMDEAFKAFADLHVAASRKQHLTGSEASHLIHDRAVDYFEESRGWETIEGIVRPYWNQIEELRDGGPVNAL